MNVLIAIALLVALVWAAIYVLRGSPVQGLLAFLVIGAVLGHPFFHFELGPLPLTLDRLLLAVLLAAFVAQRVLGNADPKPWRKEDLLLVALVAWIVLSGSLAGWYGESVAPWEPLWRLLGGYLVPLVVYWIARQSRLGPRELSATHGLLVALGAYLAVTGICEITQQWWAVFPAHIADPKLGIHFGRARGPMVHAVSFGFYTATCLLAVWVYRWRFGRVGRAVLLLLAPLLALGVLCSFTRSVWMGVGLAALAVLTATLHGRTRVLVVGGLAASALLVAVVGMESLSQMQREDSAADSRKSVSMRACFTYVSWMMFCDRPLLGCGFGQFPNQKLPYLADRSTDLTLEDIREYVHHNTFLSLLTELGAVGLGLLLALLAGWFRAAWRLAQASNLPDWARAQGVLMLGTLAVYVCQALFHELTYTPICNSLLFLLAGLTMGLQPLLDASPAAATPHADEQPRRARPGLPSPTFTWLRRA